MGNRLKRFFAVGMALCSISLCMVLPVQGETSFAENMLFSDALGTDLSGGDNRTVSENSSAVLREEKKSENAEQEILQIVVPASVRLTLDPYKISGKDQIYSEVILIENRSTFAVTVNLNITECRIPQEEAKSCELYLNAEAPGFPYRLVNGKQMQADSFVMPGQSSTSCFFTGNIQEGSEALWKAEDMRIKMVFTFERAQDEIKGAEQ